MQGKGVFRVDLWRISVSTTSEAADAVSVALEEVGAVAVEIEDRAEWERKLHEPKFGEWVWEKDFAELKEGALVHGYFEYLSKTFPQTMDDSIESRLESVRLSGLDVGSLSYAWTEVLSESYLHTWKADYHAINVSSQMTIIPSWEQGKTPLIDGHMYLLIDPGVAFGTGTHQTTLLCLQALESLVRTDMMVLDIGTGTGILAIAAAKLGAKKVIAVDVDEVAVRVARENARLNEVDERIDLFCSDLLHNVPKQGYHIITANLLSDLVLRVLPDLDEYIIPGGVVLFSGIVMTQVERIVKAMEEAQFVDVSVQYLDDWAVISGCKKG